MPFRLDAGEFPNPDLGMFTERQLEQVRSNVLQKKLPPLSGPDLLPQDMSLPSWKRTYVHKMFEILGSADFVGDDVDDFPLVSTSLSEETFNIRKIGVAYKHSIDQIERAEALGMDVEDKQVTAARRAIEEKLNEIMWFGDERQQLFGAANYPDSPHVVLSNTIDDSTNADTIKNMLTDLLVGIFKDTKHTAMPNKMWMATDPYFHISDRELNPSGGGDTTILEWIVKKFPFIDSEDDIKPVQELDGAGPDGEDLIMTGRIVEEVLSSKIPQEFTQRNPQVRNEAVVTNTVARSGGVASDLPMEFLVAEVPKS